MCLFLTLPFEACVDRFTFEVSLKWPFGELPFFLAPTHWLHFVFSGITHETSQTLRRIPAAERTLALCKATA